MAAFASATSGSGYSFVAETSDTAYDDTGLSDNTKYYYVVTGDQHVRNLGALGGEVGDDRVRRPDQPRDHGALGCRLDAGLDDVTTYYYKVTATDATTSAESLPSSTVSATPSTPASIQSGDDGSNVWAHRQTDLTTLHGTTVRIVFRLFEDGDSDCTSMNVDNVSVTDTP